MIRAFLREFYGTRITRTEDLTEKACCANDTAARHAEILALIPESVKRRNYGCGSPIPEDDLTGLAAADLGCGAGLDAFILAKKVGPEGSVIGIDMTGEQLAVAREAAPEVMRRFGYESSNVAFLEDFIETASGIPDSSLDLVVSNCVVNLSPRKDLVLSSAHRVLKTGGELYMSDIVVDRRTSERIRSDPRLIAECMGGAEYEHDFLDMMKEAGFRDPRIVRRSLVAEEALGEPARFFSVTIRAQRFEPPLDPRCEDYGQTAVYLGNLEASPARFAYDDHHVFEAGRPAPVCRNTARMLSETRLGRYFRVTDPIRHFGLFGCRAAASTDVAAAAPCC